GAGVVQFGHKGDGRQVQPGQKGGAQRDKLVAAQNAGAILVVQAFIAGAEASADGQALRLTQGALKGPGGVLRGGGPCDGEQGARKGDGSETGASNDHGRLQV